MCATHNYNYTGLSTGFIVGLAVVPIILSVIIFMILLLTWIMKRRHETGGRGMLLCYHRLLFIMNYTYSGGCTVHSDPIYDVPSMNFAQQGMLYTTLLYIL